MSITKRLATFGVAALCIAVAVVFMLQAAPGPSTASADDAYRTTTLATAGGLITATMNSTLTADETWSVTWYSTPSGGSETQEGASETSRTDGITSASTFTVSTDVISYPSGATVRAYFRFYAPNGLLNHAVSRTVTTP